MGFGANGLHQAAFEHVGGSGFGGHVGELADEPAGFFDRLGAILAAGGEMGFEGVTFGGVEGAESVGFVHFAELVAVFHDVACNPSFKRNKPLRIQLFTVPRGSLRDAAISE